MKKDGLYDQGTENQPDPIDELLREYSHRGGRDHGNPEEMEWILEDRDTLILRRTKPRKSLKLAAKIRFTRMRRAGRGRQAQGLRRCSVVGKVSNPGTPGNEGPSYAKAMEDVQRMGEGWRVKRKRKHLPTDGNCPLSTRKIASRRRPTGYGEPRREKGKRKDERGQGGRWSVVRGPEFRFWWREIDGNSLTT